MRDVISLMQLMKEIGGIFTLHMPKPIVHCDVCEDNEMLWQKVGSSAQGRSTLPLSTIILDDLRINPLLFTALTPKNKRLIL